MLIETGTLSRQSLAGQVAIVTGAGRGIGFEAARALIWLGAHVVIAEIDKNAGKDAAGRLAAELGMGTVTFIQTDVGDEQSVARLANKALSENGKVDIVLNNATIAPLGAVKDVSIKDWDASYRVNLRGPVLMTRAFVPDMLARDYGVLVCVSSAGQAYMGMYEILKTAQVELANTLNSELKGTGVITFTIGPGFVPTQTALSSIPRLAAMLNMEERELLNMVKEHTISVEAAGAGFAAAIALANRYRGKEISSTAALYDAGIELPIEKQEQQIPKALLTSEELEKALSLCRKVRKTLEGQAQGWKQRAMFERQWMIRTFKKHASMTVEQWLEKLERLECCLEEQDLTALTTVHIPYSALAGYYAYLYEAAKGYVKDPVQREEQLGIVRGWQEEAEQLKELLEC